MAAESDPLFVPSRSALLGSLRLDGVADTSAAQPIVSDCILRARVQILREVGLPTVNKILATPSTTTPLDPSQVLRVEAEQLETLLVKRYLIVELPTAFLDAGGSMPGWYQKEAPYRLISASDRAQWVTELEQQVRGIAARICASQNRDEKNCNTFSSGQFAGIVGDENCSPSFLEMGYGR